MATILNPLAPAPTPAVDYAELRQLDLERQALDHEKMFLDTDAYITGLPQEQQAALNSYLEWAPDPEGSKRKSVNRGYIGDFYGLPDEALGEGGYQTYRDRYAREVLGVPQGGELNDDSFFELMKQKQQKQKDYRGFAEYFSKDALNSTLLMEPREAFAEADRIKKDSQMFPGMDKEDGDRLASHWVDQRMQFEERAAPLRPEAREIYAMLAKGKDEGLTPDSKAGIEGAIDRLAMLAPDERAIVVAMLKSQGGTDTTGALTDKLVMSAVRGLAGQFRGYSSNTERGTLLLAQSMLSQGDGLIIRDGESVELAVTRKLIESSPSTRISLGPYAGLGEAFAKGRAATPEEVKQAQAIIERKITRSEVAQQAIGILEGTIDPIKPNKGQGTGLLGATGRYAQGLSIATGESFGAMAPIMFPMAGVLIAQGGYADAEYQKLREEGNDPETAHVAAQMTGALEAGFERAAFLFNFVPTSTIAKLTAAKAGSKLMGIRPALETSTTFRILSKMGTTQAAEYGEEIAQAAAPILTGFLGEQLGWNLAEQSKFLGEWKQFKEEGGFWRPEVFATVMMLAVSGGGYSGLSQSVQAKAAMTAMLGNQTRLESMGIAPAKAAEIVAMPETERQAAYQAAYPERNPSAPEAVAAQKLVTAEVDAQKAKGAAEVQAMESEGLSVTRTADGWAVTDLTEPDTAPIPHATAEEAMTTVRGIVKARGMKRQDTFLDALGEYVSFMESGRTIELSNKSTNLLKELETAVTQDNKQWVEDIWDRADQERSKVGLDVLERDKLNPDSAAALFGMKVLGRSKSEAKGNVAKAISYVMADGQILDLVEEQAENDMGDAVEAGEASIDTVEAILRRIEAFTGDKYIFSNTAQGIKEAWSAVVRLYTTGTKKGNKITKGARQETAAALRIQRQAVRKVEESLTGEATGTKKSDLLAKRQKLLKAEEAGITPSAFIKMREYLAYLKGVMGQVYRLQKARDAGLLDDLEAMIRESVGLKEQDALEAKVAESVPTTYNLETGQDTSTFGYSISTKRDADYMAAVESGDVTTQQAMVDEAAKESGLPILDDSASEAFRARRTAAPKKTLRAFKLFATKPSQPGALFPLFVGANDAVPQGIWLDAIEGKSAGTTKTGRPQVKSKLGPLAFRPGWHAGDMPLATHIGIKNAEGKVFARRANEVWAEVEMAQDVDYQEQANQSKTKDLREMPVDGAYRFKTNPNMTGNWIISGSMKIKRVLSQQEVDATLRDNGIEPMPWDGGELILENLGLTNIEAVNKMKLGDPITYDESGNVIPLSQRFNPESSNIGYSIKSIAYLKDDTRFEKLKEDGRVETGVSINDFIGKHLMMHAPDNAFTGTITLNNGKLIVGKGGAYYPSLFANQNYFWASTKATAEKTANHLNLMAEKNGGKIYMALVSSPVEKLFSSTTMATGAVHWFESLSEDKAASLSKKDLNTMLGAASELAEDKDRKFSTRLNASTLAKNLKNLEAFLDPTTSTFGLRKSFVEELAKQVETYYKDKPKAAAHVAQILADAQNKHAGTKLQKGQIAWNPILQGIGNALTEPFLRTFQEHGNGRVYAIIEVDGPVEAIASTEHESYPFAIVPVNRKSKVKLSILDEAMDWQDIIGDSVTGQYTPAAERKNYMPTGGMSVTRLKVLGPRPGTVANQIGYSIAPARKTSLEMQMTRDEILDAIEKSKDWKDFYTTYQYLLDEYFGDDATAFQSILSITSQAASVKANVAIALRMYGYWKRGEEFDGKKRGEAESGALSGVLRNLERWRDDVALSGRKISNYQAANEGKEGATEKVVVDRHIANMLFGTKTPTGAQFTEAEKVLTEIAQSIGWEPRQVQAALWAASIRKSGTEPASYDQYLKTLRARGTIYERTGATPGGGGIFAAGVERPIRRPTTRKGAGKAGTDGYSITTAAGLENIKAQLDKVAIDPDVRFNMMQRAAENLSKMVRDIGFRDDVASAANDAGMALLEQQQATVLAGVVDRYSAEEQQRLRADEEALKELKARHETALQDLSVKADIEAGGAQEDGFTADQKDALKVRQRLAQTTLQARQRAEKLALETKQQKATDAARAKEQQEVNLLKQEQAAQRKANEQKTGEREQRATMLDYLAALDTILMPFPAEVRNKVGGFVSLAGLRTNAAMNKYLKDRVEKLNTVLENYMRKEYTIAMERLLKKAEPTKGKPGEKMAGKLGPDVQHLMDMVRTSLKWTAEDVNAHIAGLQTTIDGGTLTAEQEVLALREIELVQLAGDWTHADAAKRSAAVQAATETYEGGYLAWKAKLIAKREAREQIKAALITDTGKAGTQTERDERAKKDLGWMGKAKDFWLSLSSFEELTRYVFGEKSEAATQMVDRERAAAYQYEDATTAIGDLVQQHFNDLAGGHLKGEQLRFRLSQKTINTPSASLSELEAIQAILLWNQEDGKRHMIGTLDENNKPTGAWHYNQDWVDSVMAQMTPEGKATMAFIQRIYAEEWATLNPLYRERHGVNLPRHENYAPITVAPVQAKGGEMVDPVSGAAMTGSILTPGSLRTRSRRAIAEPEFRDALQTMLAHTKQMEHWKAYYDFAVDAQAILGNRDVGNAVQAAAGKEGKMVLRKWLDIFSQGGSRDAGAALAGNRLLSTMSGRAARMALVGRVGTLLIQSTQLAAASAEMPVGAYVSRLGRLLSGNLGWKNAIRSEFIQRRIQQAPPIVRQAMEGMTSDRPNVVRQAANYLGTLISGADGLFTSGTYAILLDYHMAQAAKLNITGPEAADYANRQAERITERVAQPTRMGTRSLFENTQTSPLAKLGWAFASEARQKIALAAWAARNAKADPARAARVAFLTWVVGGLMAQVIRNAWKDLKDDDDDTLFDDRNWNLKQMVASTLSGPLQGIPGLGSAFQSVISNTAGTYNQQGNLLDGFGKSVPALKGLISGESMEDAEPVEEIMKDVEAILTAAGMVNETAASATSLFHLVRDGSSVLDGLQDDEEELKAKAKAADRREAAERKKQRMEQGAQ